MNKNCLAVLYFPHVHHVPYFQNLHMWNIFSSWKKYSEPHHLYKMHISLNYLFYLSHIEWEAYSHALGHKVRPFFRPLRTCHKIDFIKVLDNSFQDMIYDSVCWNWSRNSDNHLSTFDLQKLCQKTTIKDKHRNSNLFHQSRAESWNKRSFNSWPGI